MSPKHTIQLDKAIRFARMASQALDVLIWESDLSDDEKKSLEPAESALTNAAESLGRVKARQP